MISFANAHAHMLEHAQTQCAYHMANNVVGFRLNIYLD